MRSVFREYRGPLTYVAIVVRQSIGRFPAYRVFRHTWRDSIDLYICEVEAHKL
jgi:hypothetical protein